MRKFRISAYILFIISLFIKYISSKYSYIVENYYSKNIDTFKEKVNKTIFEDEESVFEIIVSIIDTIYVERIDECDDKQKLILHIKFNILDNSYEEGSLNLNDFLLLFS